MGRPTGPAPAGTAAEAGLTPALTARIPSESGVLGGACGRPGPERGSAVHRGVSGPSLCPPQAPAGQSSPWPLWPWPSWPPVSSASSAGAAADAHPGGSPGTRRPWAWPGSAAPPPTPDRVQARGGPVRSGASAAPGRAGLLRNGGQQASQAGDPRAEWGGAMTEQGPGAGRRTVGCRRRFSGGHIARCGLGAGPPVLAGLRAELGP